MQLTHARSPLHWNICRCYDGDCPDARRCARWLDRYRITPRTPSVDSLFPFSTVSALTGPCPSLIEVEP